MEWGIGEYRPLGRVGKKALVWQIYESSGSEEIVANGSQRKGIRAGTKIAQVQDSSYLGSQAFPHTLDQFSPFSAVEFAQYARGPDSRNSILPD